MSQNDNNNNDDTSYLIMVNTMSNVINIIVNDKVKQGSIVPKPQLNLSFSIKDLKKLLYVSLVAKFFAFSQTL